MTLGDLIVGSRTWLPWAVLLAAFALGLLAWAYVQAGGPRGVRTIAALLKAAAIVLLAICLIEPLWTGTRPRPGSNLFLVVADNSRSLQLADAGRPPRGKELLRQLNEEAPWMTRLGQDFDVRRYAFDSTLRPVKNFSGLPFDGTSSTMATSLASLQERFKDQPVAGILLFTDGNATDLGEIPPDWSGLPPVFAVPLGDDKDLVDLSVSQVAVSQTNFDAAPVTIVATIEGRGLAGKNVVAKVVDQSGKELERRVVTRVVDGQPVTERFLIKPEQPGVGFYSVQAVLEGEEQRDASAPGGEATRENNRRIAVVDRGGGPYRVLYVSGRPNWEFKFLKRAIDEDDEIHLTALVRIAKKEPKFAFLGRQGESTNPLFRGFGNSADEAEQYDEPVLRAIGTQPEDLERLRSGFPKDAETLYPFHAIVLDDIEAAFFTRDQLSLIQQFVSDRGGGLLMLGGKESFAEGGYQRTPVGDLLPIYLDRVDAPSAGGYRLELTREGWLQPWVRVRPTEPEEEQRLAAMPAFRTLNPIDSIKPGATVLAQVKLDDESLRPALIAQPFGRGRTSALMIGDLWRWDLRRSDSAQSDLGKSWRQTVRWLVSDVPKPVEVETRAVTAGASPAVELVVRARDKLFEPLDNATVQVKVRTPDQREVELTADSSSRAAGEYSTTFVPRESGPYHATATVTGADGSEIGRREFGWAIEPESEEFKTLAANRPLLEELVAKSDGAMVSLDELDAFVAGLPNRKIPITESWTYPLWHRGGVLALALLLLVAEWGLRRWKGLP